MQLWHAALHSPWRDKTACRAQQRMQFWRAATRSLYRTPCVSCSQSLWVLWLCDDSPVCVAIFVFTIGALCAGPGRVPGKAGAALVASVRSGGTGQPEQQLRDGRAVSGAKRARGMRQSVSIQVPGCASVLLRWIVRDLVEQGGREVAPGRTLLEDRVSLPCIAWLGSSRCPYVRCGLFACAGVLLPPFGCRSLCTTVPYSSAVTQAPATWQKRKCHAVLQKTISTNGAIAIGNAISFEYSSRAL